MRPTLWGIVNHRAPSTPTAMFKGELIPAGSANSVITPAVVIRPILAPVYSVNQIAPSGPVTIPIGPLLAVGTVYSVKVDACPSSLRLDIAVQHRMIALLPTLTSRLILQCAIVPRNPS